MDAAVSTQSTQTEAEDGQLTRASAMHAPCASREGMPYQESFLFCFHLKKNLLSGAEKVTKVSLKRPRRRRPCNKKSYMTGLSMQQLKGGMHMPPALAARYGPPQQTGQVVGPARAAAPHPVRDFGLRML